MVEAPSADTLFAIVESIRKTNPSNRTATHIDREFYESLSAIHRAQFWQCIRSGIENKDSEMGCYAMRPTDLMTFRPLFSRVIGDYHRNDSACMPTHVSAWDLNEEQEPMDLSLLGLKETSSIRVRVARNLTAFNLPGARAR